MSFIKKHKNKLIAAFAVLIMLAASFFAGGTPENNGTEEKTSSASVITPPPDDTLPPIPAEAPPGAPQATELPACEEQIPSVPPAQDAAETPMPAAHTAEPVYVQPVTQPPAPAPAETAVTQIAPSPAPPAEDKKEHICTISVNCAKAIENADRLSREKLDILPSDGVILPAHEAVFYEGESVFNLLARETKKNRIHLEFVNTPVYNSTYIEGIGNLYEYDCGELSGWLYKVNGSFPGYGCSSYTIEDGDVIEWVYTCDLGRDVGGEYSYMNGK